jgi:hypothetical protein
MTFREQVSSLLGEHLASHGYRLQPPVQDNAVHFRSSAFDVVVYTTPFPDYDLNARVRRVGSVGDWSPIRAVIPNEQLPNYDDMPIGPRPEAVIIRELGDLIVQLLA